MSYLKATAKRKRGRRQRDVIVQTNIINDEAFGERLTGYCRLIVERTKDANTLQRDESSIEACA